MESQNYDSKTKPPLSWADWIFIVFCYVLMGFMCFVPRPPFARTMLIITALVGSIIMTVTVVLKLKKQPRCRDGEQYPIDLHGIEQDVQALRHQLERLVEEGILVRDTTNGIYYAKPGYVNRQ